MSDIDWSEAPEGATHAGINEKGSVGYFYRLPGVLGDYDYWNATLDDAKWSSGKGNPALSELIPRPSPAWNGEGLPPVGVECERSFSAIAWKPTTICGHSVDGVYAAFYDGDGHMGWGDNCKFRPIRTPEQIAADEREAAIDEMMQHSSLRARDGARQVFGALYDAGYRKQADK